MRLRPLFFLVCAWIVSQTFLPAAASAQTLAGQVLDRSSGTPVPLAFVILVNADSLPTAYAYTDTAGHFLLTAPKSGSYWLDAESGFFSDYRFGPVSLFKGDTLTVGVALTPNPVELDELVVEAKRRRQRMTIEGYFAREASGTGWHLDREKIERYAHFQVSTALRTVPGLRLAHAGYGDREPFFGGWRAALPAHSGATKSRCYPSLFINGMMLSPGGNQPTNIDRVIRPEDVEAIEVFRYPNEVPGRFYGVGVKCGVIAVWSR
jgi:hypothetical protein